MSTARTLNLKLVVLIVIQIGRGRGRAGDKFVILKGALKAHIHISLYESNTLQEQDSALLFRSVIP